MLLTVTHKQKQDVGATSFFFFFSTQRGFTFTQVFIQEQHKDRCAWGGCYPWAVSYLQALSKSWHVCSRGGSVNLDLSVRMSRSSRKPTNSALNVLQIQKPNACHSITLEIGFKEQIIEKHYRRNFNYFAKVTTDFWLHEKSPYQDTVTYFSQVLWMA